jgi:hypothetical protein
MYDLGGRPNLESYAERVGYHPDSKVRSMQSEKRKNYFAASVVLF